MFPLIQNHITLFSKMFDFDPTPSIVSIFDLDLDDISSYIDIIIEQCDDTSECQLSSRHSQSLVVLDPYVLLVACTLRSLERSLRRRVHRAIHIGRCCARHSPSYLGGRSLGFICSTLTTGRYCEHHRCAHEGCQRRVVEDDTGMCARHHQHHTIHICGYSYRSGGYSWCYECSQYRHRHYTHHYDSCHACPHCHSSYGRSHRD